MSQGQSHICFAIENRSHYAPSMTLNELRRNQFAQISGFSTKNNDLEIRLREIGFAEGDRVELMHVGLFGRNPITVKLNGTLIAMRRTEAEAVTIELDAS